MNGGAGPGIYTAEVGSGLLIEGNYVGTNITGTAALPNAHGGIALTFSLAVVTVGGTSAGAGNLVSGNTGEGISNGAGDAVIQGNYVGTNAAGTTALPNGGQGGVYLYSTGSSTVGGTGTAANLISGNQ